MQLIRFDEQHYTKSIFTLRRPINVLKLFAPCLERALRTASLNFYPVVFLHQFPFCQILSSKNSLLLLVLWQYSFINYTINSYFSIIFNTIVRSSSGEPPASIMDNNYIANPDFNVIMMEEKKASVLR